VNNPFRENARCPAPLFYDGAIENQGYERGYEKEEQQRNQQHQMSGVPKRTQHFLNVPCHHECSFWGAELTRTT
jgi:hypothetical protein